MILRFQNVLLGDDVDVLVHGLFRADERLMGTQGHGAAGVDQCIARNARLLMIGAAEAAVDDHETSPALDGALTVLSRCTGTWPLTMWLVPGRPNSARMRRQTASSLYHV